MGGCRCTYRNCKVKSDGKTHMFHYPVFDKVRCHRWLLNAQRLEFLDLKVSQLKNRCVCQHHFKPECFMNFKRDKLTFEAVPTLNGPYCEPSIDSFKESKYPHSILVEDIENDFDINDKKSNFSLKYADFLTNNEFVDSSARYNRSNIKPPKNNSETINLYPPINVKYVKTSIKPYNIPIKKIKEVTPQQITVVPPYSDLSNELKIGKELNLEQNMTELQPNLNIQDATLQPQIICINTLDRSVVETAPKPNQDLSDELKTGIELNLEQSFNNPLLNLHLEDINSKLENNPPITPIQPVKSDQGFVRKETKVKILSEKKIKEPINIGHISGKFEKISPSNPLILPDKSHIPKEQPEIVPKTLIEPEGKPSYKLKVLDILNVEFDSKTDKALADHIQKGQAKLNKDIIENNAPQTPPKKSTQIKNKVTPERSAAIERKRKFNLKLKDIIESCLDKLDEPEKNHEISPNLITNLEMSPTNSVNANIKIIQDPILNQPDNKSIAVPSDDKKLSLIQDYTINYLEERMKKMETTLLDKIAQNEKQIIDFRNSFGKHCSQIGKSSNESNNNNNVNKRKRKDSNVYNNNMDTYKTESSYKKFLFQEISKYLSPSSKSVIYEELFINKYSCVNAKSSPKKKRRRCI